MPRISATLWRSITAELLKLLLLTAAVLVTLVAFAAAVKPLSDGTLRAADALKYILLAIPPMMAYALPFAGGFSATLAYHRLATDLESLAAHAGGISHRSLLAPAATVGLCCALGLTALNEEVIPRFLRQMQALVTADIARLLAQQIEKGQAVEVGGLQIIADRVRRVEPDPSSGALDQLLMTGFAAVMVKDGKPVNEATAAIAKLWVLPADEDDAERSRSRVIVRLEDAVGVSEGRVGAMTGRSDFAFLGPDLFRDNVKFLTWRELRSIKQHPERMNWVAGRHRTLAAVLAQRQALALMSMQASTQGLVHLADDRGVPLTIRCGSIRREERGWIVRPAPGEAGIEVRVARVTPGEVTREAIITSAEGVITIQRESGVKRATLLRLDMEKARARESAADAGAATERAVLTLDSLVPQPDPLPILLSTGPRALYERTRDEAQAPGADPELVNAWRGVGSVLRRLDNDVLSKRHERLALATSCAVMVITGAISALAFSRRQPLTVYLFTFAPATLAFVTVSGGQQVTTKQGEIGLLLMWSGVAILAAFTFILYARIRRH